VRVQQNQARWRKADATVRGARVTLRRRERAPHTLTVLCTCVVKKTADCLRVSRMLGTVVDGAAGSEDILRWGVW
jgi:hypothetical protein